MSWGRDFLCFVRRCVCLVRFFFAVVMNRDLFTLPWGFICCGERFFTLFWGFICCGKRFPHLVLRLYLLRQVICLFCLENLFVVARDFFTLSWGFICCGKRFFHLASRFYLLRHEICLTCLVVLFVVAGHLSALSWGIFVKALFFLA